MMLLRAALFDLDGVLVDTQAAIVELWKNVCDRRGRDLSEDELRSSVIGCSAEHTVARLFPTLRSAERDALLATVREADRSLPVVEIEGAVPFARALAAHEVPIALVTGASRERVDAVLLALGLDGCFSAVVAWNDAARGKPYPDCYELAAHRLGLSAPQALVFEDSAVGVTAAVAAGAVCVGVGPEAAGLRAHGAALVAESLAAIGTSRPGAGGPVELFIGPATLRLHPQQQLVGPPGRPGA